MESVFFNILTIKNNIIKLIFKKSHKNNRRCREYAILTVLFLSHIIMSDDETIVAPVATPETETPAEEVPATEEPTETTPEETPAA